jgi:hypothetical protein
LDFSNAPIYRSGDAAAETLANESSTAVKQKLLARSQRLLQRPLFLQDDGAGMLDRSSYDAGSVSQLWGDGDRPISARSGSTQIIADLEGLEVR